MGLPAGNHFTVSRFVQRETIQGGQRVGGDCWGFAEARALDE